MKSVFTCVLISCLVAPALAALNLPAPNPKGSAKKFSRVIGWPANKTPIAPPGFKVTRFADGFKNPRWIYVGPNGDVFVAEASSDKKKSAPNRITLLRGENSKGQAKTRHVFLSGLKQPLGMLILNDKFYVANTDSVWSFPYKVGENKISGKGKSILKLPSGGRHWTRNLALNGDGTKIYVAVGSSSNVAENGIEKEKNRARILEINPDGTAERVFASGLRNPVGLAINPVSNELWTAVNERDELGDDLVPDYLTSVRDGGFYGWPYSYFGANPDPRLKGQGADQMAKAIVPELALGAHTASLGLAFYTQHVFPAHYQEGAFIGQHGSWNRSAFSGYRVIYVPFTKGYVGGEPEDFLTGFIADEAKSEVYGRPVGVAVGSDGSLLVADDGANIIWKVTVMPEPGANEPAAKPAAMSGTATPVAPSNDTTKKTR